MNNNNNNNLPTNTSLCLFFILSAKYFLHLASKIKVIYEK